MAALAQAPGNGEGPAALALATGAGGVPHGRGSRCQQQCAGARALQPQQGPLHRPRIHPLGLLQHQGALGQAATRFLARHHHQIGTRSHGFPLAMGLIHQHRQARPMAQSHQSLQIPHLTLVAGIHQHQGRQGTGCQGRDNHPLQVGRRWGQPQAGSGVKGQIKQDRLQVAQQTAVQQGAMQVAGQQHPTSRLCHRQQGGLQQATGPIHPKPTALGTQQIRAFLLGLGHPARRD